MSEVLRRHHLRTARPRWAETNNHVPHVDVPILPPLPPCYCLAAVRQAVCNPHDLYVLYADVSIVRTRRLCGRSGARPWRTRALWSGFELSRLRGSSSAIDSKWSFVYIYIYICRAFNCLLNESSNTFPHFFFSPIRLEILCIFNIHISTLIIIILPDIRVCDLHT